MLPRGQFKEKKVAHLTPLSSKMHSSLTAVHCHLHKENVEPTQLNLRPTLIFLKAFENIIYLSTSVCSNGSLTAVFFN